MRINKAYLDTLTPCFRYDIFLKEYPGFDGTLPELLDLDRITFEDKLWLIKRMFSREQLVQLSLQATENVDDDQVRAAISEIAGLLFEKDTEEIRRQTARTTASIVGRVVALAGHAGMEQFKDPGAYLSGVRKKQKELLRTMKDVWNGSGS